MLIYWAVWLIIIVLALMCQSNDYFMEQQLTRERVWHSSTTKFLFVLASLILIIVAGCRYNVGADFWAYYNYEKYLDLLPSLKSLNEPGIHLIYNIAVRIHRSNGMCIFVIAAVTLGLELSVIYKNTDNIGFALPVFAFTCWTACFNGVRQALAVAVLFCGFSALRDRRFVKYVFFVFCAFLCHKSVAIMLLVFFISNRKVNIRNVVFSVVVSVIVLHSYDQVYNGVNFLLDHNLTGNESYWSTKVNILRIVTEVVPAIFFLYMYRFEEKTSETNFYLNLLVIHGAVAIVTSNSAAMARMVMYTMPFAVISMAELIKLIPNKKRQIYSVLIISLFWIMEAYECYTSSSLNPFTLKWIW